MKKLLITLSLLVMTMMVGAVPAKKGLWRTITLSDGTEVRAQLAGDEHAHFFIAEDGRCFMPQGDTYVPTNDELLQARRLNHMPKKNVGLRRMMKKVSIGEQTHYTGKKKGIVILAQFQDTKFKTANNNAKYNKILNQEDYTEGSFKGSVADYFRAQSGGIFELEFDVLGPYTMNNNASYYGKNNSDGDDTNPDEMVVEALLAADSEVNFADYDWDGDGEVDQVFVLYAGTGEADGGAANTIWPHMYYLSATGKTQYLDDVIIDTYACSNEVTPSGSIEGIGCFCHEFSHCMGFPDFYDTSYSGWFGMNGFDLMDEGSYNGNGFQPAGYSAYEKWMSGWLEPIELNKEEVIVENLTAISTGGEGYIIYNDGNRNEYYMVENRQKIGWDASLPGKGLMITHVDFDKDIWEQNTPNTKISANSEYVLYYGYKANDHQRFTIFHADNTESGYNTSTDLYPYSSNDSLTDTSKPAATLYNKNTDGKKLMHKPITDIKQNSDKTISFKFNKTVDDPGPGPDPDPDPDPNPVIEPTDEYLFYESFDKFNGKGGNDGYWSTQGMAYDTKSVIFDNVGWTYDVGYAGYQCARFGNNTKPGTTSTPTFRLFGEGVMTFKAAGWGNDDMTLNLSVQGEGVTIEPASLTMTSFAWTDYTVTLRGQGTARVTFKPAKRFLLDEVLVIDPSGTTAITTMSAPSKAIRIYTLDGRYVGSDASVLGRGIYIINGKKVVK